LATDIDRYELTWIYICVVALLVLFGVLLYSAYALGIHVETDVGQIHPAQVATTPPFDQPGLRMIGPDHYEAVIVARAWVFDPPEIRVPVGSTVTFKLTSIDVIHGFKIPRTGINRMIVPGQISEVTHRFDEPGTYTFFCHEYCGSGHHIMNGGIVVEPR
jgi:Heme/copper-type cytochrome/quinol oxidases, subunit 2